MKKSLVVLLIFIFLVSFICVRATSSNVRINEIESNPSGNDAGAEWVEIYSDGKVNLDGWKLQNKANKTLNLSSFGEVNGILIINFEKQFLNNKDEKISIYDSSNKKIDESDVFSDSKNNDMTWQICSDGWILKDSTKGKENSCGEEISNPETTKNYENNKTEATTAISSNKIEEGFDNESVQIFEKSETKTIINLNPQESVKQTVPLTGKVIYRSTNEMMREYAIYAFALFLIVIIAVLLIKK